MEKIILFYKYIPIEYPKQILKWQRKLCTKLNLKGRIILGSEGINATLGGHANALEGYKTALSKHQLFGDIDFKESAGSADDFPRLAILIKNEIVNLGVEPETLKVDQGGIHLKPEQAHTLMEEKPDDLVILDCRNSYETCIGTFKGAIRPKTRYFREFPQWVDDNIALFKNKQVLMDCTGGIRCERASAYLKQKGIAKQVYQIEGGIHRYVEKYPDGFFRGKNYVFDRRIAVQVNDDILGQCYSCNKVCDEYTNCFNAKCNLHFISCAECTNLYNNTCGSPCKELLLTKQVNPRPYPKY